MSQYSEELDDSLSPEDRIRARIEASEQYAVELLLILQRDYEKELKGKTEESGKSYQSIGSPYQVMRQATKEAKRNPEVIELEKIVKDSNKRKAIILGEILIEQSYMRDRTDYFPILDDEGNQKFFENGIPMMMRVVNREALFPNVNHARELLDLTYELYAKENERRSSLVSPIIPTARKALMKDRGLKRLPTNAMLQEYIEGMLDEKFEDWIHTVKIMSSTRSNTPNLEKIIAIKTPAAEMIFNGKFNDNPVQTRNITRKTERGNSRYTPRKGDVIETVERLEHVDGVVSNIDQKMLWNAFNSLTAQGETFITPEQIYYNSGLSTRKKKWHLTEDQKQYIVDSLESMFPQRYTYYKEDRLYGSNEFVPATRAKHPNMTVYEEKIITDEVAFDLMPRANYIKKKIGDEIVVQGWELIGTGEAYTCPIFRIGYENGNYIQIDPETLCEMKPKRDSEIGKMVFDYFFFHTGYGQTKRTLETFAEKYGLDLQDKEVKRTIKDQMRKIGKRMKEKGFLTVFDDSCLNEGYIRIRSREHKTVKQEAQKIADRAERVEIRSELAKDDPLSLPTPESEPKPEPEPTKIFRIINGKKVQIK